MLTALSDLLRPNPLRRKNNSERPSDESSNCEEQKTDGSSNPVTGNTKTAESSTSLSTGTLRSRRFGIGRRLKLPSTCTAVMENQEDNKKAPKENKPLSPNAWSNPLSPRKVWIEVENVRIARASEFFPPDMESKVIGIENVGNSCFLNASMQALMHTDAMLGYFTRRRLDELWKNHHLSRGAVSLAFLEFVDTYWKRTRNVMAGAEVAKFQAAWPQKIRRQIFNGKQHDAAEFLLYLFDLLHSETNIAKKHRTLSVEGLTGIARMARSYESTRRKENHSIIDALYNVITATIIACTSCSAESLTFAENRMMILELPQEADDTTLQECLRSHFSDEEIEEWLCSHCGKNGPAVRSEYIWKLPIILILQLTRFSSDGSTLSKNETRVCELRQIDLNEFIHPEADRCSTYKLNAIIAHRGSLEEGHYTASVRHSQNGNWYLFNDETVLDNGYSSRQSYILFYERLNTQTPLARAKPEEPTKETNPQKL